jgi:hypothetical protein
VLNRAFAGSLSARQFFRENSRGTIRRVEQHRSRLSNNLFPIITQQFVDAAIPSDDNSHRV